MTASVRIDQQVAVGEEALKRAAGAVKYPLVRLARAFGITALGATLGNLLVYFAGAVAAGVPGEFIALNPGSIIAATVGGTLVGAIGLLVLTKLFGGRGAIAFTVIAALFTLVSLGGPANATAGMPGMPPATVETAIIMALMHVITGGAIAFVLPALARGK